MMEKKITVQLEHGLHIRPAKQFVKLSTGYQSEVTLTKGDKSANGKSILGLMSMAIQQGEEVTLTVQGSDEVEAMAALEKLLTEKEG